MFFQSVQHRQRKYITYMYAQYIPRNNHTTVNCRADEAGAIERQWTVLKGKQKEVVLNLQITGSGGVSGWTFGWKVKVRVRAVKEGFPPLAVRKVGLYNQTRTRAGLGFKGTAPHRQSILHIKTEKREQETGRAFIQVAWTSVTIKTLRSSLVTLKYYSCKNTPTICMNINCTHCLVSRVNHGCNFASWEFTALSGTFRKAVNSSSRNALYTIVSDCPL